MLPTIAREDDAVVMIDQRKLPGAGDLRALQDRCRGGARHQDDGDSRRAGDWRGRRAGHRARHAPEHRDRHAEVRGRVLQDLRADGRHAADGGQSVLGDRSDEAIVRRRGRAGESVDQLKDRLDREADLIHDEDVASCRAMGAFGAEVVPADAQILTHCNAGALATAGYGTALGVIRGAVEAGKQVAVFADETRPFLQGARLTAWELVRDGIDTTVITDNMSGALMRQGKVNFVVVGADRIAANGDTANKIGTYSVAVLAREHQIPFYVAAPLSTIDLKTADGSQHSDRGAQQPRSDSRRRQPARAGRRARLESGVRRDAAPPDRRHHHRTGHLPRAAPESLSAQSLKPAV